MLYDFLQKGGNHEFLSKLQDKSSQESYQILVSHFQKSKEGQMQPLTPPHLAGGQSPLHPHQMVQ